MASHGRFLQSLSGLPSPSAAGGSALPWALPPSLPGDDVASLPDRVHREHLRPTLSLLAPDEEEEEECGHGRRVAGPREVPCEGSGSM